MPEFWKMCSIEGWKFHFVSPSLFYSLVKDAEERGHTDIHSENCPVGIIDLPGMVSIDRTYSDIKVGQFTLTIPNQDFEFFYDELKNGEERTFSDGKKYYKIHGWLACVVFSPEERTEALAVMESIKDSALKLGNEDEEKLIDGIKKAVDAGANIISHRVPESLPPVVLSGAPNDEKN